MEVVIDIPKEAYELLQTDGVDWLGAEHILSAVAKGAPLPEHHGKLLILDENLIKQHLVPFDCSNSQWLSDVGMALSTIKIIPVTKEGGRE